MLPVGVYLGEKMYLTEEESVSTFVLIGSGALFVPSTVWHFTHPDQF